MKCPSRRRGQAVIIGTLIMVAASALLTSIMLYWGLSLQGQSLSNFGGALASSNSAASEQISIDSVFFYKASNASCVPSTPCYLVTVYARNSGNVPVKIAGVHILNLQSGFTPAGYDCEMNPHATIVAGAALELYLKTQCKTSLILQTNPTSWGSSTVSIEIATEAGTSYTHNYTVPP